MATLVGFIGAPSTGKTTLAQGVYNALQERNIPSVLIHEFVTEDIQNRGIPDLDYYIYEQYRFLFHQMRREESVLRQTNGFIITDMPIIIGYAYSLQRVKELSAGRQNTFDDELHTLFKEDANRYDHLFFLEREASFEDNGIRFHSEEESKEFSILLKGLMNDNNVKYQNICGDIPTREKQVLQSLGVLGFQHFVNSL